MSEAQETYSLLPVEECAIHPLARIRFDYGDTGDLAESMKMMGQVQPGKATEQANADGAGARYLVYIGCRRLVACKKASLKYFKAIVVKEVDEGRLQRELLTENVKRANLSVLEELNMLANYSKHLYSLDELAKDIGLSQRLVRERVMLATRIQGKNLVETFYKIERISGFSFTYRHIEKITALEEDKWLPLAIHAAELNWKAEDIESLGRRLTLDSLMETLPAWGRQFTQKEQPGEAGRSEVGVQASQAEPSTSHVQSGPSEAHEEEEENEHPEVDSPSRYQTVARSAQFLICPKCGSESVVELPRYPDATLFRPGQADEKGKQAVSLGKESMPFVIAVALMTCTNDRCGRRLVVTLDQSGEGLALAGRKELLALIGKGLEPENGGRGALVWDDVEGIWLKSQLKGEDTVYYGYDGESRRWVIPLKLPKPTAQVSG
jgi:ParB/RepB/Spo0J family partition protein